MHYKYDAFLPFILQIRVKLEWKPCQSIPDWMTEISWFDGDIPQLQTMMFEAREALDNSKCIIRNKHTVSSAGTQQPYNMSPVFYLLKDLQERTTAWNDIAVGLADTIRNIFVFQLCTGGLNLGSSPQKKNILIDFLCYLPEMADQKMSKKNIISPFVEA